MEDEAQDVDVVAINYLGKSRRTYAEDTKEDLSICVLEAAAQPKQVAPVSQRTQTIDRSFAQVDRKPTAPQPST